MIPTINTARRIFLQMPASKRKSIINTLVNTHGLKSPRTKAMKDRDSTNSPRQGAQRFLPLLFETVIKQNL